MNINDITTQGASISGRKTAFGANSFLSIGRKGQTVEGTISAVSDRISINFNGVEVTVSPSAVQNAKEGEVRKFRIMDVSKDNIVLKEVGNNTESGETRAMMGTSVSTSSYSFADYLADSQMASEAGQEAGQNLTVLTGEDYQSMESEQGALEEYKESELDRAIERKKEKTKWQQERQQAYHELRQENEEAQAKMQSLGFLELKSPEQIANILKNADLPVSDANITRITSAMEMAQNIQQLSDNARAYIIQNQLPPTIENLYHGQYSGSGGVSVASAEEETWQLLLPQVTDILNENNINIEMGLSHAKWLFANDLPVTVEALRTMQVLDEVQQMNGGQVMEQILQAMSSGAAPEKASLDNSQFVAARNLLQDFANVTTQDIMAAITTAPGVEITLQLLKDMRGNEIEAAGVVDENQAPVVPVLSESAKGITQTEMALLTTKRQLEEIRLKMTLQSAVKMSEKGINIEVTPLKELVDELRQMENTYYTESLSSGKAEMTQAQGSLLQETLAKVTDIKNAPAAILGSSIRQELLLTVNQLHKAAVSATVQMQRYQTDFEAVGTQVRKDLGDSIKKAFANIPDLLDELQIENTQANQRAVRILGYNQMEVTEENILLVKENDARVNAIIDSMRPSVVMELIRQGKNPLDIPLDELNQILQEIAEEQDVTSEEKYSRYLWQLEQENGITAQEREGYIGIYRLLNQIEKSDGAAIGAVLDAEKEMTLGNLLTAVRTWKGNGIDAKVDDSFGGLSDLHYTRQNISQQLETGFGSSSAQSDAGKGNESTQQYYEQLTSQALKAISPAALQQISDGDMEQMLNTSLEMFKEQLEGAAGNPQLERSMYEECASQLREVAEKSQQAAKYLNQMNIPDTMANLQAAERLLEQGYDLQKEAFGKRKLLEDEECQAYETEISEMSEGLESEETMLAHCEKLEGYLEKILERAYEQKDVSSLDLWNLKLFGQGLQLQKQLSSRHSYDIPIMTGDTVTSLNVTLIQGTEENGKVQISISSIQQEVSEETDYVDYGNISMEIKVSAREIKGLVLCDSRIGYDRLCQAKESVINSLEEKGYQVKNLSYGMDYQSRSEMAGGTSEQNVPTSELYQVAKTMVQHIMQIVTEK